MSEFNDYDGSKFVAKEPEDDFGSTDVDRMGVTRRTPSFTPENGWSSYRCDSDDTLDPNLYGPEIV